MHDPDSVPVGRIDVAANDARDKSKGRIPMARKLIDISVPMAVSDLTRISCPRFRWSSDKLAAGWYA